MKKSFLSGLSFAFLAVIFASTVQSVDGQSRSRPLLVEGVGTENIVVGKSTIENVFIEYGSDYRLIEHGKYSLEYFYKQLGLAFYACRADPNKEVFVIVSRPKSGATTTKGIVVGRSTKAEVEDLYYDQNGIEFFYGANDVVNEIDIFEDGGIRQCDTVFGIIKD